MFKYPMTTYSGGNKVADTTWTTRVQMAALYTFELKSQILGSGVTDISFQISVLPFTSYVTG